MADTDWYVDKYCIESTPDDQVFVSFWGNTYKDYGLPLNWIIT